ncbi:MAG: putative transrane anti-sigma factor [Verrucomicrobia bacterium]|nr:putative transrane anti-sigma factor [Verrucomicrobiota bacterium]
MKESKFIELLNLYVDHHISPADAALLEAEVRTNGARRNVYRQYCQMQKACHQLGEAFRIESPAAATTPKIIDFKPRRPALAGVTYAAGIIAVAACIAVAFVVRSGGRAPGSPAAVATHASAPAPASVAALTAPAVRPALQPAFGPRSLTLRGQNAELAENAAPEQVALRDWMDDIRLSSMQGVLIEDLRFDGKPALPSDDRVYRSVRPFQGKVEMTAFKFQR